MKKKIKDLTIGEISKICKQRQGCYKTCPLYDLEFLCLGTKNMSRKNLNIEIEFELEDVGWQRFRIAMAKLGYTKEILIDALVDCYAKDNCVIEELNKMSIKEIYFKYKDACCEFIEESIV